MNRRTIIVSLLFLLTIPLCSACQARRSPACQAMRDCCEKIKDFQGVGMACNEKILDGVEAPESCVAVLQSVDAMFETKKGTKPTECSLPKN